jgi:hypothetical protein
MPYQYLVNMPSMPYQYLINMLSISRPYPGKPLARVDQWLVMGLPKVWQAVVNMQP